MSRLILICEHPLIGPILHDFLKKSLPADEVCHLSKPTDQERYFSPLPPQVTLLVMHGSSAPSSQMMQRISENSRLFVYSPFSIMSGTEVIRQWKGKLVPAHYTHEQLLEMVRVSLGVPKTSLRNPLEDLSSREKEIFILVSRGKKNQEVACLLHLKPDTVKTYKERIRSKIMLKNDLEWTFLALKQGLISAEES